MGQVIQIDEARIKDHLGEMVRGTVEEALNAMLDAEADQLCGAGRYERTEGRRDTRAGSYERSLDTKAGPVKLKVPKLRRQTGSVQNLLSNPSSVRYTTDGRSFHLQESTGTVVVCIDLGFACAFTSVDAAIFQKEGHGDKAAVALRRAIQNLRTQIDGLNPQDREGQGAASFDPIEMIIDRLGLPAGIREDRHIRHRRDFFMRGERSKS